MALADRTLFVALEVKGGQDLTIPGRQGVEDEPDQACALSGHETLLWPAPWVAGFGIERLPPPRAPALVPCQVHGDAPQVGREARWIAQSTGSEVLDRDAQGFLAQIFGRAQVAYTASEHRNEAGPVPFADLGFCRGVAQGDSVHQGLRTSPVG